MKKRGLNGSYFSFSSFTLNSASTTGSRSVAGAGGACFGAGAGAGGGWAGRPMPSV